MNLKKKTHPRTHLVTSWKPWKYGPSPYAILSPQGRIRPYRDEGYSNRPSCCFLRSKFR